CAQTRSPSRWALRHTHPATSSVAASGTTVTATPSTEKPEPWATSHPTAPRRTASPALPCAPASLRYQAPSPSTAASRRGPATADRPCTTPQVSADLGRNDSSREGVARRTVVTSAADGGSVGAMTPPSSPLSPGLGDRHAAEQA